MAHTPDRPSPARSAQLGRRLGAQVFYWMPIEGQRHALCGKHGSHQPGDPVETLCGADLELRSVTDGEWIRWPTCDTCWQVAKAVLGGQAEQRAGWR